MKIDYAEFYPLLKDTSLEPWIDQLPERIAHGLRVERHGKLPGWEAVLAKLPDPPKAERDGDVASTKPPIVESTSSSLDRRSDVPVAYVAPERHLTNYFAPKQQTAHLSGNLPHWRQNGCLYFVTFRLADALPSEKLHSYRSEKNAWLKKNPKPPAGSDACSAWQNEYKKRFQDRIDRWLDAGYGRCILRKPDIRKTVEKALLHFDGERYRIDSFVVMPNHVHILIAPLKDHRLSDIVKAWKSYTSHELVKKFGVDTPVWQKEYFDHIVRSSEYLEKYRTYIIQNPTPLFRARDGDVASTNAAAAIRDGDVASTNPNLVEATSPSLPLHVQLKNEVCVDGPEIEGLEETLSQLHPWRKGPYSIHGVHIDTEWRSDWKWDRVRPHLASLEGRTILDVGCGNGYHCWRMAGEGARLVVGVDPTPLFICQFFAMKQYLRDPRVWVLPLGIEETPEAPGAFDTVFSMGVLYHRKSPIDHLLDLKQFLRPGGELVLETLVVDGPEGLTLTPPGRYGKMRNVWFIPSVPTLERWLARCGFNNIRTVDVSATTTEEQRSTDWMTFESLPDFLDPSDPAKTIEGHPAPKRAICIAEA